MSVSSALGLSSKHHAANRGRVRRDVHFLPDEPGQVSQRLERSVTARCHFGGHQNDGQVSLRLGDETLELMASLNPIEIGE